MCASCKCNVVFSSFEEAAYKSIFFRSILIGKSPISILTLSGESENIWLSEMSTDKSESVSLELKPFDD